jgi:tyrosyl-tRNA synthetase
MTYKIFSFVEKNEVTNPEFVKESNERTDDVVQLGDVAGRFYFSIDTSNVTVDADDASEAKTYDFSKEEDVAEIKAVIKQLRTVSEKISKIETAFIAGHSLYSVAKALASKDKEFITSFEAAEAEKETLLQGLGLPGTSILA